MVFICMLYAYIIALNWIDFIQKETQYYYIQQYAKTMKKSHLPGK